MKTALLAIALVLQTLPASAAMPGLHEDQLAWQACFLRDELYGAWLNIGPLHNDRAHWVNTWRNWRDLYTPDSLFNWIVDRKHMAALVGFTVDRGIAASIASHWFGLSYDAVVADLDPANSPTFTSDRSDPDPSGLVGAPVNADSADRRHGDRSSTRLTFCG